VQILLVEHSLMLRRTLSEMAKQLGHAPLAASSAQAAIELLDQYSIDMLLVNPDMPANSGIELLYEMQSYGDLRDIPSILMVDKPELYTEHQATLKDIGVSLIISRRHITQSSLANYIEHVLFAIQ